MPAVYVDYNGVDFIVTCKEFAKRKGQDIPDREIRDGFYQCPVSIANARYFFDNINGRGEQSKKAKAIIKKILESHEGEVIQRFPAEHKFKSKPRPYQRDALNAAYNHPSYALFMEMRTGKSFVDINLAARYFIEGRINAYLIVTFPGAIKSTWGIQLEEHMPLPYDLHYVEGGKAHKTTQFMNDETHRLKIMVVGIESMQLGGGPALVAEFVNRFKVKMTIDESTCIKNPKALTRGKLKKPTRVKHCWNLGGLSEFRMIMTGTPITQGMEDLYSQFRFLDWQIIGHKSFFTFKNKYCIVGGFDNKQILGYADESLLLDRVAPYVFQITTEDAIGIPETIYNTITVEPSADQSRLLKELGDPFDMSTTLDDKTLTIDAILTRLIRYQQIVGGHFPYDDLIGTGVHVLDKNPKLDAMMDVIETIPKHKRIIVWARFLPEIKQICDALAKQGYSFATFEAGLSDEERVQRQKDFMSKKGPRFWVATQKASARGVELASASVHIYFSNTFSYDERKQSEMRTMSSHQTEKSILYLDIAMKHKIDKKIIDCLRRKKSIADFVTEELQLRSTNNDT